MTRKQRKNLIRIVISGVLCLCAYLVVRFTEMPWWGDLLVYLPAYFTVGYDVIIGAVKNILRGQVFDERFLMAIATVGAFVLGEYVEGVLVMLFYQVGELFQSIAVGKSRKAISSLMDIRPDKAVVVRDGEEVTVFPEEVLVGEKIVVKVGEKVPLDGVVTEGATSLNYASLTGESLPVDKTAGDTVLSGSINLSGVIEMRTTGIYEDSTVAKILNLVENSATKKAKSENFITKFAKYYTPCVVVVAILLAILPPLCFGQEWTEWVRRALVFLVVSCPCALVISVPLSFFGGIGGASKKGVLIKGANYLEMLAKSETVIFDKTGTLTKGNFAVSKVVSEKISESDFVFITASVESFSNHPIAKAIASYAKNYAEERVTEVKEIAGKGIDCLYCGEKTLVGNALLLKENGIEITEESEIGTVVYLAKNNEYLGKIVVSDELKTDAETAVSELKSLGVSTAMLTGDRKEIAEKVAFSIGIDEVRSELLPTDKVIEVEKILQKSKCATFVGDGINDAPVLMRADVGVAMGGIGSDSAIEAADVVIMDDKPSKVALSVKIARKTMNIVRQNIIFALLVKLAVLVLGAVGIANMYLAVFADVGVTVIAVLNAMRALRIVDNVKTHKKSIL